MVTIRLKAESVMIFWSVVPAVMFTCLAWVMGMILLIQGKQTMSVWAQALQRLMFHSRVMVITRLSLR